MDSDETRTVDPLTALGPAARTGSRGGPSPSLRAGDLLGRYLLLYRIGSGGMGVVYAAYDPELDRKVALKLLQADPGDGLSGERLRREARALARLAHPNVVAVYDVGTRGEQVFLAMEHVEGRTLGEWLASRPRSWREILTVFGAAGRGLAAAHAAGIVHGDFKPGNVLVGSGGAVKVVDFGLARRRVPAALPETPEPPAEAPLLGAGYGTPGYMAPERSEGGHGDARSDQFSFCAALHQALWGTLPKPDTAIREGPFRDGGGPSGRWVPPSVRRALARGLRRDPGQRHGEMETLLSELSPERRRRRRLGWAAAAVLPAIGLAILLGRSLEGPTPCSGAREQLVGVWDEAVKAEVRSAFSASGLPFAADAFLRFEGALDRYTDGWVAMRTETCRATHVLGEQSQQLLDLRVLCLDDRLHQVGALAAVLSEADAEQVERSTSLPQTLDGLEACADRAQLTAMTPLPADPELRRRVEAVAATSSELFGRYLSSRTADDGAFEAVVAAAREAGHPPLLATVLQRRAMVEADLRGDTERSVATFHEALAAAIAGRDGPTQASIYAQLIDKVGYQQGRFQEAERWASLGRASLEALGPGHPKEEAGYHGSMGNLRFAQDRADEALGHYRRALAVGEGAWGKDSPLLIFSLNAVAMTLDRRTSAEDPMPYWRRALAIGEREYGPWSAALAPTYINLASHLGTRGRYEDALAAARKAFEVLDRVRDPHIFLTLLLEGQLLVALDRPEEGEALLRRALPLTEERFGSEHFLTGELLDSLSEASLHQGRLAEAEAYLQRSFEIDEGLPADHLAHFVSLRIQGRLDLLRGRPRTAARVLESAREMSARLALPTGDRGHAELLIALGNAYLRLGDRGRARRHLEELPALGLPDSDAHIQGEGELALAEALWREEPERALKLGRSAARKLAPARSWYTRRVRDRARAWLAVREEPRTAQDRGPRDESVGKRVRPETVPVESSG